MFGGVWVVVVEGIDRVCCVVLALSREYCPDGGVWKGWVLVGCGGCARCWVPDLPAGWLGWQAMVSAGVSWWVLWCVCCLRIVEWTRASFVVFVVGLFGDKLLRAIGGCLGIKSR